jgi:hypothetical protein
MVMHDLASSGANTYFRGRRGGCERGTPVAAGLFDKACNGWGLPVIKAVMARITCGCPKPSK